MSSLKFSKKGQELINLYETIANHGYERTDKSHIDDAFSDFELRTYICSQNDVLWTRMEPNSYDLIIFRIVPTDLNNGFEHWNAS